MDTESMEKSPRSTVHDMSFPSVVNKSSEWRPSYFRRPVLVAFLALFLLIIAAIEALQGISKQHQGLTTSRAGLRYIWTYGPVAFLTMVAALWSRVEYQTRIMAPWLRLSHKDVPASRTLLLDYVSMILPKLLYVSARNRDAAVTAATVVSILIKILIIISTGLITLSPTLVTFTSKNVTIEDSFIQAPILNDTKSTLPYHVMQSLMAGDIDFPQGISQDFAYQSTSFTDLNQSAQVEMIVEGLENGIRCQPAEVKVHLAEPWNLGIGLKSNFTISSPDCSVYVEMDGASWPFNSTGASGVREVNTTEVEFARLLPGRCKNLPDKDGQRLIILVGLMNYTDSRQNYPVCPTHCEPTYNMTQVRVIRNGTQATDNVVEEAEAEKKSSRFFTPSDIMDAHFDAYRGLDALSVGRQYVSISQKSIDVTHNQHIKIALEKYFAPKFQHSDLYDPDSLEDAVKAYYRQFGAIIAKQTYMAEIKSQKPKTKRRVIAYNNRLVVREMSAQLMAGITAICAILCVITLLTSPRAGVLPRNPGSLAGIAGLIVHSPAILKLLRNTGAGDDSFFKSHLHSVYLNARVLESPSNDQEQYRVDRTDNGCDRNCQTVPQRTENVGPIVLGIASRLALCSTLTGLIVAIQLTLRKSSSDGCLGHARPDDYIHFAWTAGPTLVFGSLAMVISITDWAVRTLLPYTSLKTGIQAKQFFVLEYLDRSLPGRLYWQLKFRSLLGTSISLAVLVSSFFTIISASLFSTHPDSISTPIELKPINSFGVLRETYNIEYVPSYGEVASALFSGLYDAFPQWTWADLAFPEFAQSTDMPVDLDSATSQVQVQALVPAFRGKATCRKYDASSIQASLLSNFTHSANWTEPFRFKTPIAVRIAGEECNIFSRTGYIYQDYQFMRHNFFFSTNSSSYFGQGGMPTPGSKFRGCSQLLYTWGSVNHTADPPISFITAMGCNVTIEAVDASVKLRGPNLTLEEPPVIHKDTAREAPLTWTKWKYGFSESDIYDHLFESLPLNPQDILSRPFSVLTNSPQVSNITASMLGDNSQKDKVADTLLLEFRQIIAQLFSANRHPANSTNATLPVDSSKDSTDDESTYPATITYSSGRLCVAQDPTSTHILTAMLAVSLVLIIVGWLSLPDTKVLPRSPTTIASAVALISGGNLLQFLPEDSQWCSDEQLARHLNSDSRITMGWNNVPDEELSSVRQKNEADGDRFGIFVRSEKDVESDGT